MHNVGKTTLLFVSQVAVARAAAQETYNVVAEGM